MKKILLLQGFSAFFGFSAFAQQYAAVQENTSSNDEVNTIVIKNIVAQKFTNMEASVARYRTHDEPLGKNAGVYSVISHEGDTVYKAGYKKNKLNGPWISSYANNALCDSGSLKNNMPDGTWKTWYPNGTLRSVREYSAYKLERLKNNLQRYNHKINNDLLITMEKRNPGTFKQHTSAAESFHHYIPANLSAVSHHIPIKEKAYINSLETSDHYFPPFTECLHDGVYLNYFPNGELRDSGYYKNGFRTGLWIEKGDDGTSSRGTYHRSFKTGAWSYYNSNGKLIKLMHYNHEGKEMHKKHY